MSRAGSSCDFGNHGLGSIDSYLIDFVISFSPPILFSPPLLSSPPPSASLSTGNKRRRRNPVDSHLALPAAGMPFSGDFSGAAWNGQALLATYCGKQHAKMRRAWQLACTHDFVILEETHSNVGKTMAARIPQGLKAFWSHGSNRQAGVALFIKYSFFGKV